MTTTAVGCISRIVFHTDLTRGNAPVIPLGFLLEGAWIEQARWLGLIARTSLTPTERDLINLATWPELENPFAVLESLYKSAWEAEWGKAGAAVQSNWKRSALSISTEDESALIAHLPVKSEADWLAATNVLDARLSALGTELKRLLPPGPPRVPSRTGKRKAAPRPTFTLIPTGRRVQDSPAHATAL